MVDGLADVHLEPTDPASHEVVDCRSNPPQIAPLMPYMMGKKMTAPEPNTNPNGRPPVPAPFTREKHAMIAPTINPRIAYVTRPTMNADLGPMRLTVAIVFLLPNLARMLAEDDSVRKGYSQCG